MKNIITCIIVIICASVMSSCKKDIDPTELCDTEECIEYYSIWKALLMERNNISEDYFNKHITPKEVRMSSYVAGKTFDVTYDFKVDWAKISARDQFTYYVYSSAAPFPSLQIPKEQNLNKEEINRSLSVHAWAGYMNVINPVTKLKFKNKRSALKELRGNDDCKFEEGACELRTHRPVEPANGNIFMNGNCTINEANNQCLEGRIDLVNGARTVYETACWYN